MTEKTMDDEQPDPEPKKQRPWVEFVGHWLAFAMLLPVAIWLKQHHFIADWLNSLFQ